ncbi:MAG: sulfatase [Planctomycetes bacterium]|nr:sulfatase [Planctomycetota bacterium]
MDRSNARRWWVAVAGGVLTAAVVSTWFAFSARSAHAQGSGLVGGPPDIVVLVLDDLAPTQLRFLKGAPGDNRLRDQIRRLGIKRRVFKAAYSTTPLCCPSRASILRAQFAHNTGIHFNNPSSVGATDGGAIGFTQRSLDQSTIATWLNGAGYRTGLLGKYLNGYEAVNPPGFVPPGWSHWRSLYDLGQGGYWNFSLSENGVITSYPHNSDADYGTDVDRAKAIQFIASTPANQPLFMYVGFVTPHTPAIPAPRHAALRPTLVAPRPPGDPAYLEDDVTDKHPFIQAITLPRPQAEIDEEDQLYRDGSNALASVTDSIIDIISTLDATGRLDNTLLLILSDNGYSPLEHRLRGKRSPFAASVKTPLVALTKNGAWIGTNGATQSLVANVDIAPTITQLAGVSIPGGHHVDGISFVSLLQSAASPPPRNDVLVENFGPEPLGDGDPPSNYPAWSGIITGPGNVNANWKYVEYNDGFRELYDLTTDPFELINVVDDPDNLPLVATLHDRLIQLMNQ